MFTKRYPRLVIGFAIIFSLVAFNLWMFTTWFKTTYLDWYLNNGALISLVIAMISLSAGDINKHTGLISPHPLTYVSSYLKLVGLTMFAMSGYRKRTKEEKPIATSLDLSAFETLIYSIFKLLEVLIAGALEVVLIVLIMLWLIVVGPLQYFVFLICGAPTRVNAENKAQSTHRLVVTPSGSVLEVEKDRKIPEGWWESSLDSKPIAVTNLFASLFLFILKSFTG